MHVIKKEKYENEISHEAAKNGWRFDKLIMEVGARGFVTRNVSKALNQLELPAKKITNILSLVAQKCSYVIWINRFNQDFQPWRIASLLFVVSFHRPFFIGSSTTSAMRFTGYHLI